MRGADAKKKIFISYRRIEPDQSLARLLVARLDPVARSVFWDINIDVGQKWADVIETEIRNADFFVVLISADSMRSDMVRGEIKLAHEQSQRSKAPLTILPIRLAYEGELPYDLGAYLDPIQYALWRTEADSATIADQIVAAVTSAQRLPETSSSSGEGVAQLFEATEKKGAPLPKAELRFETGAVKLDSPFYVARTEDARVLRSAAGTGTTSIIKGTRQIGKSSLLSRAIVAAKKAGLATFYLDFQILEKAQLKDLGTLFKLIARRLAKELRLTDRVEDFWSDDDGPKYSISEYLRHAVLSNPDRRVAIFFDEVDRVFEHAEYRDDFFGTVRFWHNERANPNDGEKWDRLNIVIAHSTEPSLWIQDLQQSPFNVGDRVRLRDFTTAQMADLNDRYGGVLKSSAEVGQLRELVSGHPYLVRQAFYSMVTEQWRLAELERQATSSDGPFGDHLKRYVWGLAQDSGLKAALKAILKNGACEDENHFQRLAAVGLIDGTERSSTKARCRLYETYFHAHL